MEKQLYKLLMALCIMSATKAMGKSISAEQALDYSLIELTSLTHTNADPSQMKLVGQKEYNNLTTLYIFSSPQMYVIASGNDDAPGLLAYSLEGGFSADMSPSMGWWLEQYSQYIGTVSEPVIASNNENRSAILPMMSSKWDQCAPYNSFIPRHNGNTPYTGCVATAMAQIMRHHEWPDKGEGTIQWTCNRDYGSHDHIFNFDEVIFDWKNMLDEYNAGETTAQENAVAQLMYACGAAAEMQYGYGASGSFLYLAASGMIDCLKYDRGMEYLESKWFESLEEWDEICYTELFEGRPILYGGENDVTHTRHAFVLDGYSEEGLYHINWGWGGENNGYFKLTDFSYPGGNYRLNHVMVRGIKPKDETSSYIPAIAIESQFRTNETHYTRDADVEIWFMENFRNVSLTQCWYIHGVKCVPTDGSPEFYICSEDKQLYRPRGVNRFYTITADKFPIGTYDVYPVYKTDATEWKPCYQNLSKGEAVVRFDVSETAINASSSSIDEVLLNDVEDAIYYDMMGNKITHPQNGVFIKIANGKVLKINL